jgi:iron only hydrogenase large subunit-like protein
MQNYQRPKEKTSIVYTKKAKCRDCYRCVRVCPVQAIKMENGQARVMEDRCIACGTCIINCPQGAKAYRTDFERVLDLLSLNNPIALSVAPSFVAYYNGWEQVRLASAARLMGFSYVGETAIGAWETAVASKLWMKTKMNQSHLCTACPAVVSYVGQYAPQHLLKLVPVVSPMVAHGRLLKKADPNRKVVFVGPCVAKKKEAGINKNNLYIDAVLTFEEFDEMLKIRNIHLESCEESSFDEQAPGDSRLFPIEGGLLKTAGLDTDILNKNILAVSGYEEIEAILKQFEECPAENIIVEPLFCSNGCVNGPVMRLKTNAYINRKEVLNYASRKPGFQKPDEELFEKLEARFEEEIPPVSVEFTDQQIQEVLERTGKHVPEDELNCQACGYKSCRDKAVAVLSGLAETEMCMPYMRRKAEQKFETMIACDPNGIVLLNSNLEIVHFNEAFKFMFSCSDVLIGKKISYLIDPEPFEKLALGMETIIRQTVGHPNYNLVCHQIVYIMPEEKQYVGVFINVTDMQLNKEKLSEMKTETILKAQELMEHQIQMAQELAKFLGENTAKGEVLMSRLIDSMKK